MIRSQRLKVFLSCSALIVLFGACAPIVEPGLPLERTRRAQELVDSGTMLMRAKRLDEARAAFTLSHELLPTPAAVDGLGCVAFLEGDVRRAEKLFVKANQMEPNYVNALANLALLYEIDGRSELAERLYRRALGADPENFRARNNFAGLLAETRGRTTARAELLKAQSVIEHPVVLDNLEKLE